MILAGGKPILQASDSQPGNPVTAGDNVQVAIDCDTVEEIERLFVAFSQGAKVRLPLGTMFWGARFGMLTDRYGILWMFNCQINQ
jgi:PhnB protein